MRLITTGAQHGKYGIRSSDVPFVSEEAHEAFVAEYTALYQGFPKCLEDLVIGFGFGEKTPRGNGGSLCWANPQGLQHLTYPELVSWDFEGSTDMPELMQHAHLDNISF